MTTTFTALGVSDAIVARLAERSVLLAFPIQAATISAAMHGRDVCGRAPTGSGKTLAFGIPIVERVGEAEPYRPRALVLAPTRELAGQIKDELEPLARVSQRSIATVYGGTNIERDIRRLERGVDILVACPGRLEDLIARRCCELGDVEIAVVDEADRMADMGFLPAVKRILDQTADERHTLLFSATLDGDVDALIRRYQSDPLMVDVEAAEDAGAPVEHSWYVVEPHNRIDAAVAVLRGYYSSIVFCRTRRGCDRVAKLLSRRGLAAVAIHGDRSQAQRERALRSFANGSAQVLVATDVAARGIHVDDVALVMHYDPAGSDKDYIHRSGRTGRAGSGGRVVSMVVEDKRPIARDLQRALGMPVGFDELDVEALPPAAERPEPTAEAERVTRTTPRQRPNRPAPSRGGRGTKRPQGGAKNRKRQPKRRREANDWYPPESGGRRGRDGGDGGGRGGQKRPSGGSGTQKRKSRAQKGRHADVAKRKNRGKRRPPRPR